MQLNDAPLAVTTDAAAPALTPRSVRSDPERDSRFTLAGTLVAAVTHDLRQPLTAIEMNVSAALRFLRHSPPSLDEAIEALEDTFAQQRRMRDSLQTLQDLAIRRAPQRETCDVTTIVREVIALVKTDAIARHVPIELSVVSVPPPIYADAALLRQAFLNILLDALEATSSSEQKHEPVKVVIRAEATAEVSVAHAGLRAEAALIDDWGLALARSVADAHGAAITLEHTADNGARILTQWPYRAE
jgi:signal transduction histidine kinase